MSASVADKVAAYVADHPGRTADEISLALGHRYKTVRDVLVSGPFEARKDGRRLTYRLVGVRPLRTPPSEPERGFRRAPTHDERVLALLADGKPHTHHELYGLHVVAHSRVASLRGKGYRIDAWREGDDYLYRLVGSPQAAGRPQLFVCADCRSRFYNLGWHAEACGSGNYKPAGGSPLAPHPMSDAAGCGSSGAGRPPDGVPAQTVSTGLGVESGAAQLTLEGVAA